VFPRVHSVSSLFLPDPHSYFLMFILASPLPSHPIIIFSFPFILCLLHSSRSLCLFPISYYHSVCSLFLPVPVPISPIHLVTSLFLSIPLLISSCSFSLLSLSSGKHFLLLIRSHFTSTLFLLVYSPVHFVSSPFFPVPDIFPSLHFLSPLIPILTSPVHSVSGLSGLCLPVSIHISCYSLSLLPFPS
jgi:hypothetical protein